MASVTAQIQVHSRQLTSADAGALLADVESSPFFQPTAVLETDFSNRYNLAGSALAAAADTIRFLFTPLNSIDNMVWIPYAMHGVAVCTAGIGGFTGFWQDTACYSINKPGDEDYPWDSVTMDAVRLAYNGTALIQMQTVNPDWHAWPPVPAVAEGATQTERALGGLSLTVGTYDAATEAATSLFFDCRWLGFPRGSERNSGYYTPRMYMNPN